MNLFIETLCTLCMVIYYWIEAVILTFWPARLRHKEVKGDTVLVTGAGSGLGRLISVRFAGLGCNLVLWDINQEANEQTAAMVREYGVKAAAYRCDLSSRDDIYNTASKVKAEVGDVDILVNNAGIVTGKKFLDSPDTLVQKTMEVNSMAHFWTVKSFLPSMLAKNHGHVVSIASGAGLFGVNGLGDYCSSKFAAVGFDESLREELFMMKKDGVNTTVVCPFYINTGMFDGVKTRFPWLLPIVEPCDAVDAIMDAVLTNQHIVCIPRILNIFLALKGFLPVKCGSVLNNFLGVSSAMDDFKGHRAVQNNNLKKD